MVHPLIAPSSGTILQKVSEILSGFTWRNIRVFKFRKGATKFLHKHTLSMDAYHKLQAVSALISTRSALSLKLDRQYIDFEGCRLGGPGLDDTNGDMAEKGVLPEYV